LHNYGRVGGYVNEPETTLKQFQRFISVSLHECKDACNETKIKLFLFQFYFIADVRAASRPNFTNIDQSFDHELNQLGSSLMKKFLHQRGLVNNHTSHRDRAARFLHSARIPS
jgi:hypothetical protein